jgi:hypothetical protein
MYLILLMERGAGGSQRIVKEAKFSEANNYGAETLRPNSEVITNFVGHPKARKLCSRYASAGAIEQWSRLVSVNGYAVNLLVGQSLSGSFLCTIAWI